MILRFLLSFWLLCLPLIVSKVTSPGATSSFSPGGQYILLTFDGGPHSFHTPQLLDLLKEKKVRASFFVTGNKAMHHPELLKRMHAEKHDVGNRGWHSGVSILKLNNNALGEQIKSTSNVIVNATGEAVKYFRPHQGLTNAHVNSYISGTEKLRVILWSLDSKDVEIADPAKIASGVLTNAKPGDVVLFHEVSGAGLKALPDIIDGLYKQGYEFLTLSQVISFPDDSPHRR